MDIYLFGKEPELGQQIAEALGQAREAGVMLEVEVRWKPRGERSSQIHAFQVDPAQVDQAAEVVGILEKKLKANPGPDAGQGQLRVNLRKRGDTTMHFGSVSRKLEDEDEEIAEGNPGAVAKSLERLVHRLLDVNVAHSNANAGMMTAGAQMVQAMNPKYDPNSPWALLAPMMPALAGKLLQGGKPAAPQGPIINAQVSQPPQAYQLPPGATQQGLPFQAVDQAGHPQGPPPGPPPQNGHPPPPALTAGPPDGAAIQAWAEANPLDAMQLVARLAKQNGIPPEQLAAALQGMAQ